MIVTTLVIWSCILLRPEDDIVRTPDSGCRMVTWNVRGLWCLTSIESSACSVNLGLWELGRQDLEVVSNQYENPELLVS
jgi:hypothetical protein